jgi:hypothetical protein
MIIMRTWHQYSTHVYHLQKPNGSTTTTILKAIRFEEINEHETRRRQSSLDDSVDLGNDQFFHSDII